MRVTHTSYAPPRPNPSPPRTKRGPEGPEGPEGEPTVETVMHQQTVKHIDISSALYQHQSIFPNNFYLSPLPLSTSISIPPPNISPISRLDKLHHEKKIFVVPTSGNGRKKAGKEEAHSQLESTD